LSGSRSICFFTRHQILADSTEQLLPAIKDHTTPQIGCSFRVVSLRSNALCYDWATKRHFSKSFNKI